MRVTFRRGSCTDNFMCSHAHEFVLGKFLAHEFVFAKSCLNVHVACLISLYDFYEIRPGDRNLKCEKKTGRGVRQVQVGNESEKNLKSRKCAKIKEKCAVSKMLTARASRETTRTILQRSDFWKN